jgi:serine/threonine-protein phosphatase 6 regulatory ankyrin repeat subunit B
MEPQPLQEAFIDACRKGDIEAVRGMIDNSANLDAACPSCGRTALVAAVERNHADIVRLLLDRGAATNIVYPVAHDISSTVLNRAVSAGHLDVVCVLLEYGADPNQPNSNGFTPLMLAMSGGWIDIMRTFIEYGADIQGHDHLGRIPLQWAVVGWSVQRRAEVVRVLVEHGADVNIPIDEPLLARAINRKDPETAIALIELGVDINVVGPDYHHGDVIGNDVPPVVLAARSGQVEVVRALLERGADSDAALVAGAMRSEAEVVQLALAYGADVRASDEPLIRAILGSPSKSLEERNETVRILLASGARATSHVLYESLRWGPEGFDCREMIRMIIAAGVDANGSFSYGGTPLMEAVSRGIIEYVRVLVECGADVNACGFCDQTPLLTAAGNGRTDIVRLLIECGADVNAPDGGPLVSAVENGSLEEVMALIEAGADVNLGKRWYDGPPLIAAARKGRVDIIEILLEHGADIGQTTDYAPDDNLVGMDALAYASARGHLNVVRTLLTRGADINFCDGMGWTALMRAVSQGHAEVVRYLIEHGADVNAKDESGRTALLIAKRNSYDAIAALLVEAGAEERPDPYGPKVMCVGVPRTAG